MSLISDTGEDMENDQIDVAIQKINDILGEIISTKELSQDELDKKTKQITTMVEEDIGYKAAFLGLLVTYLRLARFVRQREFLVESTKKP